MCDASGASCIHPATFGPRARAARASDRHHGAAFSTGELRAVERSCGCGGDGSDRGHSDRPHRPPGSPTAAAGGSSFDALFRAEHGPLMRIALALTDLIATTARTDD